MHKTSVSQKIGLVFLGFFLGVVLIETGLRLSGLVYSAAQEFRNMRSLRTGGEYCILCLGESTTALGGKDSYSSQLEQILRQKRRDIKFSVVNKGVAGTVTPAIILKLESYLNKYNPDLVVAMMGINDAGCALSVGLPQRQNNALVLDSFRIVKLIRLLRLHIMAKYVELNNIKKQTKGCGESIEAAMKFAAEGKDEEADSVFQCILERNPNDSGAYAAFGWYCKSKSRYKECEAAFKRAIELAPSDHWPYIGLGWCYGHWWDGIYAKSLTEKEREEFDKKAEEMFHAAIEVAPSAPETYIQMATYLREPKKNKDAEAVLMTALQRGISDYSIYMALGICYLDQRNFKRSERAFLRAIALSRGNIAVYIELGKMYCEQKNFSKAVSVFKKALALNPNDSFILGELSVCYRQLGEDSLVEEYSVKSALARSRSYKAVTYRSYQELKSVLKKRKIKLLCLQYPLRNIESLKKMVGDDENIIFVSNEMVFKEALKKTAYRELFEDNFAGDFGHCTAKGNRIIAENIAKAILFNIDLGKESNG